MISQSELQEAALSAPVAQAGQVPGVKALESALDEVCGKSGDALPVGVPFYTISLTEIVEAIVLAAAPAQGMPTEAELEAAGLGYPLSKEEAVARWNDRNVAQPARGGRDE